MRLMGELLADVSTPAPGSARIRVPNRCGPRDVAPIGAARGAASGRTVKVFLASLAALFLIFVTFTVVVVSAQPITVGPSALCHVTDGAFTACPDGSVEWSDVTPVVFPTGSVLYADQADLDPTRRTPTSPVDTLMLMYDETQRTTPLGPDEYVLVHFMTVEDAGGILALEHYVIHI